MERVEGPNGGYLEIVETAESSGGALVSVVAHYGPRSPRPPMHLHPSQEEHFRVVRGSMTLETSQGSRRLAQGDDVVLPRRTPHRMWNDGDEEAVLLWETRPALRTDHLLRALWRSRGILQGLLVLLRHRAEIRLVLWPSRR